MAWEILNTNYHRWGQETYPTKEAAAEYLKEFWRGVNGVRLDRFTIQDVAGFVPETVPPEALPIPST